MSPFDVEQGALTDVAPGVKPPGAPDDVLQLRPDDLPDPSAADDHLNAQAALTEIARAIVGRSSAAEVAQVVVDEVRRLVPSDRSTAWLWLPDRDAVELLALGCGIERFGVRGGDVVPLGESGFRDVLAGARPLREVDLRVRTTRLECRLAAAGQRARLMVPVLVDSRAVGILAVSSSEPGIYTAAHERTLEHLAVHLAIGLEQARLFESERRQRRAAEETAQAAAAVVSEMDQQKRLDLIVERAVGIVGGAAGGLALLDPASGLLMIRAAYGYPDDPRGQTLPPNSGIGHRVIAERRPVLLEDDAAEVAPTGGIDPRGVGSTIGVPVIARGELLGALMIQAAAGGTLLMPEDVPLIQTIADLAAVALDNARSQERDRQRRRQVEAVRSVTADLTRELDLPSLLDLILMWAAQFVHCEATAVLLWDEATETLLPTAWRGLGDWAATDRVGLGEGAAGTAAQHRAGIVVEDYRNWGSRMTPVSDEVGPTSIMAVPLIYQDRLVGVLTANRFGITEAFTYYDMELLEVFGTQAAVAIEHARLCEQATMAEALRELAQLKAELLNTVSHELRTPLSLIHGYAELLLHRAETLSHADVTQMSSEIYAGSRTLTRLVDDLLDFSRLDNGRLQLRRTRIALGGMLASLVRTFSAQPGGERIVVELEASRSSAETDLVVEADVERLHQAIGNLLHNALAYTSSGPIVLRGLRDRRSAVQSGGTLAHGVVVEVVDHGPGLAPEEVQRVWESFYRGTCAAQIPNRGSGLGLTVVKQIVELHGGTVGVRPTPGGGATFWFTLPAPSATA